MTADKDAPDRIPPRADQVLDGRRLMRTAVKGSLATLDHDTGHPYVSLVLVATEPDGTPVFLLSLLARHGKNLRKDARASLLLDGTGERAEPLTGNRLTLFGEIHPSSSPTARRRFIARHPSARDYVDFGDFSIYTLGISSGHFIGGFGRIFTIEAPQLLTRIDDAQALIDAEPDIIEHMNSDHADAVALYATELAGCPAGDWRMCGIDPEGIDLLQRTNAARIDFPEPVHSAAEARQALVALVQQARAVQQKSA
jgi:heme oxygenase (biliverdin-IX-beta and delta-forming)